MSDNKALIITDDFKEQIKAFKEDWYNFYREIGKEQTPQVDGTGKKIVNKKGSTGYDYIEESYIRDCLDRHFPGWSWEAAAPLQFLGAEWVVGQGHLVIIDHHLAQLGISPPTRRFYGVDSVRIQYSKDMPHTLENIIDVGDNCKSVNTAALKYAANRLTHIGDDVYGKRLEMEGAGTYETILETTGNGASFLQLLSKYKILASEAGRILKVSSLEDIDNYNEAWIKIKDKKGIK